MNPASTSTTVMHDSFWSIPPIQDCIAAYLHHRDFLPCILVSKTLHAAFVRHRWRSIDLYDEKLIPGFLSSAALARYRHFVHTIHLYDEDYQALHAHIASHGPFPSLLHVHAYKQLFGESLMEFVQHHTRTLQYLEMHVGYPCQAFLDKLDTVMDRGLRFRQVQLKLDGWSAVKDMTRIMAACSGIQDLKIKYTKMIQPVFEYDENEDLLGGNEAVLLVKESVVQKLRIVSDVRGVGGVVMEFLSVCSCLEDLILRVNLQERAVAAQIGAVLQKHCPRLQRLTIGDSDVTMDGLVSLLEQCPKLKELNVWEERDQHPLVDTIATRHGQTLERLELRRGNLITFEDLFLVMGKCPLLKRLDMQVNWSGGSLASIHVLERIKDMKWIGLGLEELDLIFRGGILVCLEDNEIWDMFYQQLGQLSSLKKLSLWEGFETEEFTKAFGRGLEQLSGLGALREVSFSDHVDLPLTKDQLERIVELWPKLESFEGLRGVERGMASRSVVSEIRARRWKMDQVGRFF